jgi:hypothetical protein
MKSLKLHSLLLSILALHACSSQVYNNKSYLKAHNLAGKRIAVLPAEVELTGKLPSNYSLEKKYQIEESESKSIQRQIFSQYLYKSKSKSKKSAVELMNVDQINSKLQQAGISLRESWSIDPDSLARLVGADMVLKIRVKKNRMMSESAAFGIGVATTVLGNILNNSDRNNTSVGTSAKTYNMFFDATLTDAVSHVVITRFSHEGAASWNQSPEQIIESSGRKIVRKGAVYAQN